VPTVTLGELLELNERRVQLLPADYFAAVEGSQEPVADSICCADSRVSQEGMWNVTELGWPFLSSTIGNQAWNHYEGERVVDGSLLSPIAYAGAEVALVVGHTGCGAVTAALAAVKAGGYRGTARCQEVDRPASRSTDCCGSHRRKQMLSR